MFSIEFIDEEVSHLCMGEIRIDEYCEAFQSSLSYWRQDQYMQQWMAAINRLSTENHAFFITSLTDPECSNFIRGWVCYAVNNEFVFQERIIFINQLNRKFDENNPHVHIGEYEFNSEDGEKISEWKTEKL